MKVWCDEGSLVLSDSHVSLVVQYEDVLVKHILATEHLKEFAF